MNLEPMEALLLDTAAPHPPIHVIGSNPGIISINTPRTASSAAVILVDGVEWRGQRYRSLSVVAREITGAHWSAPQFFGLNGTRAHD